VVVRARERQLAPRRRQSHTPPAPLACSHIPDETLDLFLTQEAAEAELREILEDEPDWKDVLRWCRSNLMGGTCRQTRWSPSRPPPLPTGACQPQGPGSAKSRRQPQRVVSRGRRVRELDKVAL
jgi:hypothetical protein